MKYISHRGDHDGVMENTIPSFRSALHYPIHMIETDLRLSQDKVWVLHHDHNIRCDTGLKEVNDVSFQILSRHGVPSLDELIKLVNGRVELYFDIKDQQLDQLPSLLTKINKWCQASKFRQNQFYLASFNSKVVERLSILRSQQQMKFRLGFITGNNLNAVPKAIYQMLDFIGVGYDFLNVMEIKQLKQMKRIEIFVYTLNDRQTLNKVSKMGVDGLLSDYCYLFKEISV